MDNKSSKYVKVLTLSEMRENRERVLNKLPALNYDSIFTPLINIVLKLLEREGQDVK